MLKSYAEKPQETEISEPENGAVKVILRENIAQTDAGYRCNEYIITASAENVQNRVKRQRTTWIEQAKVSEDKRGGTII